MWKILKSKRVLKTTLPPSHPRQKNDYGKQWLLPSFILLAFGITWMDKPVLALKIFSYLLYKSRKLNLKIDDKLLGSHQLVEPFSKSIKPLRLLLLSSLSFYKRKLLRWYSTFKIGLLVHEKQGKKFKNSGLKKKEKICSLYWTKALSLFIAANLLLSFHFLCAAKINIRSLYA